MRKDIIIKESKEEIIRKKAQDKGKRILTY